MLTAVGFAGLSRMAVTGPGGTAVGSNAQFWVVVVFGTRKTVPVQLSKPVLPREADLEYLPSQYLCEFVKHVGFQGITFKSSLSNGDNYALFNDDGLVYVGQADYKIMGNQIEYSQLS